MAASSRRKGIKGEREVARIWQAAGFEVRGLEGEGDHLIICGPPLSSPAMRAIIERVALLDAHTGPMDIAAVITDCRNALAAADYNSGLTIHSEVKRHERLRIPEWLAQAQAEAPQGTVPVVAFRQSRGEWFACLPLSDLATLAQS